ncbi:MAG: 4Fe-4S dicluster domain-containing protein [Thermoplasmata archaeon]|nr:4Fe-4S dicluster domain-containing protein [Thermoplasmata archaeon]
MQINEGEIEKRDIFIKQVEELSGQNLFGCYQCGRCSAGCPMVSRMDAIPSMVMRLVQLGDEKVLDKNTYWVCASCYTCDVRCPKGIDIAKVMEALRQIKLRKNLNYVDIKKIDGIEELPQIALISNFRKYTG